MDTFAKVACKILGRWYLCIVMISIIRIATVKFNLLSVLGLDLRQQVLRRQPAVQVKHLLRRLPKQGMISKFRFDMTFLRDQISAG